MILAKSPKSKNESKREEVIGSIPTGSKFFAEFILFISTSVFIANIDHLDDYEKTRIVYFFNAGDNEGSDLVSVVLNYGLETPIFHCSTLNIRPQFQINFRFIREESSPSVAFYFESYNQLKFFYS